MNKHKIIYYFNRGFNVKEIVRKLKIPKKIVREILKKYGMEDDLNGKEEFEEKKAARSD